VRAQALVRLLVQHLGSYLDLGAAAVAEYRSAWARRLVLFIVAAATGIAGVVALWAAGLVALWDTPWRLGYVAGSALLLLVVAASALYGALAGRSAGPSVGVLRSELNKDMELFQQWKQSL
jgi:uncharacterized membrane protein YqjE